MIKTLCRIAPFAYKHISVCKILKHEYSALLAIAPRSGTYIKFTQNVRFLSAGKTENNAKITKLERIYEGPLSLRIRTVKVRILKKMLLPPFICLF